MLQTPRRSSSNSMPAGKRPGQDIVTAKEAARFPAVGMTLSSYQYDPSDKRKRLHGNKTVVKHGRWQRFKQKVTLKRAVITMAVLVALIGAPIAYNLYKIFGASIFGIFNSTKLRGEDQGRVNILLAGNSADDAGHNGGELTDSIMVVSIDTRHNKAFMLSIPRDLWVSIPNDGHKKINEAYVFGKSTAFKEEGYPEGGMGLLEKVVGQSLDIPIHYYALVNYKAMRDAVNAVGGVDINVKSDDPRGLYDPNIDWTTHGPLVNLSNGPHHLNGQQALNLARARGDSYNSYGFAGSDFTRTEHQRQLLVALKNKAVSAGVLANPTKLTSLSNAAGRNVKTDFKLNEVHRLYDIIKDINGKKIKSLSLNDDNGKNLLASYAAPTGQSTLIPAAGVDNFGDIRAFLRRQMSSNAVVQEAAHIAVLNGTNVSGLASKVKTKLETKGFQIDQVGDAGNLVQAKTAIIDLSKGRKSATRAALIKLFGNHVTTQNPYGAQYDVDFIIVAGNDQTNTSGN
jgi:polyisoprenyl-teichoic acid--peptidoglycan teichoic acid transferase